MYYRVGIGEAPGCDTNRWFDLAALKCGAALDAFTAGGQYIDKLVQYDPDHRTTAPQDTGQRWEILDTDFRSRPIECQQDAGEHGEDAGSSDTYARDGSNSAAGYWGGAGDEISWADQHNDETYTLYSANYLNWIQSPAVVKTRLEVVQDVSTTLINSLNGVNVGLMYFNQSQGDDVGSQGGLVAHAMQNVATARADIVSKINALTAETWTPLSETLYEAALYYSGGDVSFGVDSVGDARLPADSGQYLSPINGTCQQNYIVYLTDGEPTLDVAANEDIAAMVDNSGNTFGSLVGECDTEVDENGMCLDDLAEFLYEGDSSPTLPDDQSITTYTIGFTIDLPVLEQTAQRGDGDYYTANDTAQLANALTNIVISILDTTQTFTSPTVAVNAFNRTQNLSDLFISVFSPTAKRHWDGNLKKYSLRPGDATIIDANEEPAIDPATGFFFADRAELLVRGRRRRLRRRRRRRQRAAGAERPADLHVSRGERRPDGRVEPRRRRQRAADGRAPRLERRRRRARARGSAAVHPRRGLPRLEWQGRLYRRSQSDGRPAALAARGDDLRPRPARRARVLRNERRLPACARHRDRRREEWAFIPQEFLRRSSRSLRQRRHVATSTTASTAICACRWSPTTTTSSKRGEKVYLFFGMRRGGDFYYGLDVSDPASPQLLWKLDGASLPGLGQTWSTPDADAHRYPSAATTTQNADQLRARHRRRLRSRPGQLPGVVTDTIGNSIYIVDSVVRRPALARQPRTARRQSRLRGDGRSMDYSIPARIRVVDLDGDGYADRMYAGDMGGQVWRFDVTNGSTSASLVAGGVIAQLGGAPARRPRPRRPPLLQRAGRRIGQHAQRQLHPRRHRLRPPRPPAQHGEPRPVLRAARLRHSRR